MKIAIYGRVSTEGQNIESQLLPLREYCWVKRWGVVDEYKDIGQSGVKRNRPELERLIDDMRKGKFDAVIVYKIDRLGRSLQHFFNVFQEFNNRGITFISYSENIDTSKDNPTSGLIKNILLAVAQFEREIIVERINSGLDRAKKEGKKLGRPKGKKDSRKRSVSGYHRRYAGVKKEDRRLKRNGKEV